MQEGAVRSRREGREGEDREGGRWRRRLGEGAGRGASHFSLGSCLSAETRRGRDEGKCGAPVVYGQLF